MQNAPLRLNISNTATSVVAKAAENKTCFVASNAQNCKQNNILSSCQDLKDCPRYPMYPVS